MPFRRPHAESAKYVPRQLHTLGTHQPGRENITSFTSHQQHLYADSQQSHLHANSGYSGSYGNTLHNSLPYVIRQHPTIQVPFPAYLMSTQHAVPPDAGQYHVKDALGGAYRLISLCKYQYDY